MAAVSWAASAPAVAHVFVDGALDDDLVVTGGDAHHLKRVRRLRGEERVTASDGHGSWRLYRVVEARRGDLALSADGPTCTEPVLVPALTVAFALTKGEKPEAVVTHLTELGVDRIVPVIARRSVVRWDGSRVDAALDRLGRVAREAAMQCRRSTLPEIGRPLEIGRLAGRADLVLADRDGGPAEELPEPGPDGWLLVVGPEGGLEPDELAALDRAARIGVGPHVLRAETAAVAAASALTACRRAGGGHAG